MKENQWRLMLTELVVEKWKKMAEAKITLGNWEYVGILGSFDLGLICSVCLQSNIYWSWDYPKANIRSSSKWNLFLQKNGPYETFEDRASVSYEFMDFSPAL